MVALPLSVGLDPFATKGLEYLLILVFLPALVLFWMFLRSETASPDRILAAARWFQLRPDRRYHPAHFWIRPQAPGIVRVGLDDFAQRLLGSVTSVAGPAAGTPVRRGADLLTVGVDGRTFHLPSPLAGTVVRLNPALRDRPDVVNAEPYDGGWIAELKPRWRGPRRAGLLTPAAAARWLETLESSMRLQLAPALGRVMQDGGTPVGGLARALAPDGWEALVEEHLRARRRSAGVEAHRHERTP